MLYASNVNRIESIDNRNRGAASERPWSAFSASYYEVLATGSLTIINDQTTIATLTDSGSTFNARISASNNATLTLSGSNAAQTGSFTMSLQITNNVDYTYNTTIYSKGIISTTLEVVSGSIYDITGSVVYDRIGGAFSTCSFGFAKAGENPATASYRQCGATSSVSVYIATPYATASLGCVNDNSIQLYPSGGVEAIGQQVYLSPYDCTYQFPTGSQSRTITFQAPGHPVYSNNTLWLASYVPQGTNTYAFKLVQSGEAFTVCTQDVNSAFFSPGIDKRWDRDYITFGGVC